MVESKLPEGVQFLVDGYMGYAFEVLENRTIPDFRDGLKPVQRRILYALYKDNKKNAQLVSSTAVGKVMAYHPHGDSSIYDAAVRMTDKAGYYAIPLLQGQGSFGKVYSDVAPASPRYSEVCLSQYALDMFRDADGMEYKDGELVDKEPSALPVRYPYAICGIASGIAVGMSTQIIPFNFWDVIDATQKYIKDGNLEGVLLEPDYTVGGHYVADYKELSKIMVRGRGKVKVRADVEIQGKEIKVIEMPPGITTDRALKRIKQAEIDGISSAYKTEGYNSSSLLEIICKRGSDPEVVIREIYRIGALQAQVSSNLIFIDGREGHRGLVIGGVYNIIEKWVEWRKDVVKRMLNSRLKGVENDIEPIGYFIKLISNPEWRDEYIHLLVEKSVSKGTDYLKSLFESIPDEVCNWISRRTVPSFNKAGRYMDRYSELLDIKESLQRDIQDISGYIYRDIESLRTEYAGCFKRRTKITNVDFSFRKRDDVPTEVDDIPCTYYVVGGNIIKTRTPREGYTFKVDGLGNSVLVGFDRDGRVLRLYGDQLNIDQPISLENYFESPVDILHLTELDGKKLLLLYKEGYVSFLDTSEWLKNSRRVRVLDNGVHSSVGESIVQVWEEKDWGEYLYVADVYNRVIRFASYGVKDILVKNRKSQTRVFMGTGVCIKYAGMGVKGEDVRVFGGYRTDNRIRRLPDGVVVTGDIDSLYLDVKYRR